MKNEQLLEQIEKVYQFRYRSPIRAPGIAIGTAMVNLALEKLGEVKKLGAIAEVGACLSDAIQALTGCTVGNKYLTIYNDLGRYALTLYDRTSGKGIRVYVDLQKIDKERLPETYKFFRRQRPPEIHHDMQMRADSASKIIAEVASIDWQILSYQSVQVKNLEKEIILPAKICNQCGESFTSDDASAQCCLACSGKRNYYTTYVESIS